LKGRKGSRVKDQGSGARGLKGSDPGNAGGCGKGGIAGGYRLLQAQGELEVGGVAGAEIVS